MTHTKKSFIGVPVNPSPLPNLPEALTVLIFSTQIIFPFPEQVIQIDSHNVYIFKARLLLLNIMFFRPSILFFKKHLKNKFTYHENHNQDETDAHYDKEGN